MISEKILKSFSSKKVLVTGGTGLIGRQVVDILVSTGADVRIVSLDKINVNDKAEHIFGDLTHFDFCKEVTKGIDCTFHIAGIGASVQATVNHPASHFVPHLMMNTNVLEASRLNGIEKLVYTSSIGAYASAEVFVESDYSIDSKPMDFAGWAKRMAEMQVDAYKKEYGLKGYSIVRPANVFGPGDNFDPVNALVIPSLISRIHRGDNPLVVWGDGSAIRDFVYSRDCAEGIILALYHGTGDGFMNLGSGKGYSIGELVETLHHIIDFNYVFDPEKPSGYPKRVMDISLAREKIGYQPTTTLAEGLKATWEWYCKHRDEHKLKMNYFKE
ncbi:MAG: NAD-dependent epimerase/dehydratase family protein [Deltaproteobacteria bacterium]|nr:NAD-dependent epimerase/dehydratase family protein [Deltaproteobacteria bacterium]